MLILEETSGSHVDLVHAMHTMPAPAILPEVDFPGAVRDQRGLRREFVKALSSSDFSLRFVPRFRIASPRLIAAEVVIRWQHRRRGVIPEPLLMGLAEKVGIASEVNQWAIMEAAQVLVRLPTTMRFSLNLTPFQLTSPALVDNINMAMDRFGILPEQLELSISEKALSGLDESALLVLATLFDDGLSIALSHFGATLGSLNLLAQIPLDCVKLDASLVRGVPHDPSSIAMIRAVTDVAHSMGARVVAQGVETEDQREILAKLRCDELQGGIAGPALTAKELERMGR
jgi:EAL domain-containing protein (putative c-di-GMP-specific phosphodiesterase class I)